MLRPLLLAFALTAPAVSAQSLQSRITDSIAGADRPASRIADQAASLPAAERPAALAAKITGVAVRQSPRPTATSVRSIDRQLALAAIITGAKRIRDAGAY